jgi:hypothetical protein
MEAKMAARERMAGSVEIVLSGKQKIGQVVREREFVLLEGTCPEGVKAKDVDIAISAGKARARAIAARTKDRDSS